MKFFNKESVAKCMPDYLKKHFIVFAILWLFLFVVLCCFAIFIHFELLNISNPFKKFLLILALSSLSFFLLLSPIPSIKKYEKEIGQYFLNNRGFGLSICAILGLGLFFDFHLLFFFLEYILSYDIIPEELQNHLSILLLGLPTFFLLWFFRTSDTRENLNTNNFYGALNLLANDITTDIKADSTKIEDIKADSTKIEDIKSDSTKIEDIKSDSYQKIRQGFIQIMHLRQNAKEYEKRIDLSTKEINLSGIILEDLNCRGADLQGATLIRTNFCNANLQDTKLIGAKLQNAKLQRANLTGANLQNAKLQRAELQDAKLQRADLKSANLQNAELEESDLQGADLKSADLQGADLAFANLQEAELRRSKLQRADLQEVNLQGADLTFADLRGTNLRGAILDKKTIFKYARYDSNTKFPDKTFDPLRWRMRLKEDPRKYPWD